MCIDLHCKCGAHLHFDGGFLYHFKCGECGQVYECDGHIRLIPLGHERKQQPPAKLTSAAKELRDAAVKGIRA